MLCPLRSSLTTVAVLAFLFLVTSSPEGVLARNDTSSDGGISESSTAASTGGGIYGEGESEMSGGASTSAPTDALPAPAPVTTSCSSNSNITVLITKTYAVELLGTSATSNPPTPRGTPSSSSDAEAEQEASAEQQKESDKLRLLLAKHLFVALNDLVVRTETATVLHFFLHGTDHVALRAAEATLDAAVANRTLASELGFSMIAVVPNPAQDDDDEAKVTGTKDAGVYLVIGVLSSVFVLIAVVVVVAHFGNNQMEKRRTAVQISGFLNERLCEDEFGEPMKVSSLSGRFTSQYHRV